jgi:hypothetical protein
MDRAMVRSSVAAGRFLRAISAVAALSAAACAHAPAAQRSEADAPTAAREEGRAEQPARALVTGSNLPQPIGRFGVPLGVSSVNIYYWRGDPTRATFPDLGRSLPNIDLERQTHPDEKAAAQLDTSP